uniref:Uncharacterized protein n=1 Tax=Arundo donax TaxID=35708 RepID=A0A0A9C6U2_ARUDO
MMMVVMIMMMMIILPQVNILINHQAHPHHHIVLWPKVTRR